MELQHQLDISKLQAEDADNLKFDLDILTEEKALLEAELNQMKQSLDSAELRLSKQGEHVKIRDSELRRTL